MIRSNDHRLTIRGRVPATRPRWPHAALWATLLWSAVDPACAQIYTNDPADSGGRVVLSNHASAYTPVLLVEPDRHSDARLTEPAHAATAVDAAVHVRPPLPRTPPAATSALIGIVARDYSVAEALIKAVIAVESGFDPNARSVKGAMGLMQLMPETARRFGARDAFAVEENLRAGTAYLRWLLDLFAGDVKLALAAYNAGEGAVLRAGRRIPDIAETRAYVPKVLSYHAHFSSAVTARAQ